MNLSLEEKRIKIAEFVDDADQIEIEKRFSKVGLAVMAVLYIGFLGSAFLAVTCLIKLALGKIWGW